MQFDFNNIGMLIPMDEENCVLHIGKHKFIVGSIPDLGIECDALVYEPNTGDKFKVITVNLITGNDIRPSKKKVDLTEAECDKCKEYILQYAANGDFSVQTYDPLKSYIYCGEKLRTEAEKLQLQWVLDVPKQHASVYNEDEEKWEPIAMMVMKDGEVQIPEHFDRLEWFMGENLDTPVWSAVFTAEQVEKYVPPRGNDFQLFDVTTMQWYDTPADDYVDRYIRDLNGKYNELYEQLATKAFANRDQTGATLPNGHGALKLIIDVLEDQMSRDFRNFYLDAAKISAHHDITIEMMLECLYLRQLEDIYTQATAYIEERTKVLRG